MAYWSGREPREPQPPNVWPWLTPRRMAIWAGICAVIGAIARIHG